MILYFFKIITWFIALLAFESRIITIIDAYDAMTSDRPYRKGMSHEYAIGEIKANLGKQFDPEIGTVFCSFEKERLNGKGELK